MSRELQFDGYWEGEAVYTCDNCHKTEAKFRFDSEDVGSKEHRAELRKQGWKTTFLGGKWYDFCTDRCMIQFVKGLG